MRSLRVFPLVTVAWVLGAATAGAQEVSAYLASCGARSGDLTCVCGWFEDLSGTGVLIDGQPAGPPVSASRSMLCFQLPPGPHQISGDPARFSKVEELEASVLEIQRSQLSSTMKAGMTNPVTWTVAGTSEPVWLELRNRTPWLADLAGGNLQRALTTGGPFNTVLRVLTARGAGSVRLTARVVDGPGAPAGEEPGRSDEETLSPRELARRTLVQQMFQLGLKAAAERFEQGVRELPTAGGGRLYPRDDVAHLLERTRDDVLRSLPAPELAAFRDFVDDFFGARLAELRELPILIARAGAPGIRLAAFQAGSASVARSRAEEIFEVVRKLFARSDQSALRRLCVRTTPEDQAAARLYPRSFPSDLKETATTGWLHLFAGNYRVEVRKQGFKAIESSVDLVQNPEEVLDCSLVRSRKKGAAVPCRLIPAAKDCPVQ